MSTNLILMCCAIVVEETNVAEHATTKKSKSLVHKSPPPKSNLIFPNKGCIEIQLDLKSPTIGYFLNKTLLNAKEDE